LPPYNELESMPISGELPLKMNTPNDAEALLVQCDKFRGGYGVFKSQPNYGNNPMPNSNAYARGHGRGQPSYFSRM